MQPEQVWAEKYGDETFFNPFVDKMFLGLDECGDYLPTRFDRILRPDLNSKTLDIKLEARSWAWADAETVCICVFSLFSHTFYILYVI